MEIAATEEERAYQRAVRRFCQREILPHARAVDRGEHEIWPAYRRLGSAGLLAPHIPEELGGGGGNATMLAILLAELSRACASSALSFGASLLLGAGPILRFGTREQQERFLSPLARGALIGCMGLTEPDAGSDVWGLRTRATRDGAHWVLQGSKTFITNAPVADIFVIIAQTGDLDASRALGAFLVERGADGLSTGAPMAKLGMRGSPTGEITLDGVRVPPENVLGDPRAGFPMVREILTFERAMTAALAIGLLQSCIERCVAYARVRRQFGRPIAAFQAIQIKLARMQTDLLLLTATLRELLRALDEGRDVRGLASAAKIHAAEATVHGALEAIQIFGGYGYTEEQEVERILRDAKLLAIGGGTTEIQQLILARSLLGEHGS
jgi:alkylation response protein AidB-like acyl-CoA dehydrogenase